MPLQVLLILVIVGIAGVALALHLLGLSGGAPLDEAAAKEGWARHFPDDHIIAADPNDARSAALILTDNGLGLVWRFGADTVARRLTQTDVSAQPSGLMLRFLDFGAPRLNITLNAREQENWARRIQEQT